MALNITDWASRQSGQGIDHRIEPLYCETPGDEPERSGRGRPSRRAVLRGVVLASAALAGAAAEDVPASAASPSAETSPHFPDDRLRETRVLWQAATSARGRPHL